MASVISICGGLSGACKQGVSGDAHLSSRGDRERLVSVTTRRSGGKRRKFRAVAASDTSAKEDTAPKVVIIGAGIQGICSAYYLSKRGVEDVTIVERADSIAPAASGKAGGFLAGGWGDGGPTQGLHRESFKLHAELAEELGIDTYRRIPTLSVAGGVSRFGGNKKPPVSWLDGDVARASLMDDATAQVRLAG